MELTIRNSNAAKSGPVFSREALSWDRSGADGVVEALCVLDEFPHGAEL